MITPLDFEHEITDLEIKLDGLRHFSSSASVDIGSDISRLEKKYNKILSSLYKGLTPWQKVLVARHPERPHFVNYIEHLFSNYQNLAGDRYFGEDQAIMGGLARFDGMSVVVLGQEKGHDIPSRLRHNFGMPKPEGYRKAQRLMRLAERFQLPLITFVDTAGAHPGVEAEERGQAEAIAQSIATMADLTVPVITVIAGEGGSGGAIAIAVANEVLMLEHSIYSVVSPEGCASILWRTADKKMDAATAQKFTAQDLLKLGIIDYIIKEPIGGAHRFTHETIRNVGLEIKASLARLMSMPQSDLKKHRHKKFLDMGQKTL